MTHFLLRQLLRRDLPRDPDDPDDLARLVALRHLRRGYPAHPPVRPHFPLLLVEHHLPRRHDPLLVVIRLLRVLRVEEIEIRQADRLRRIGELQVLGEGPVDPHDPALPVLEVDVVRDRIQEAVQEDLLADQQLLHPAPLA
jgi:hypothetical protein